MLRNTVVGVVSYGARGCSTEYPQYAGVFARVQAYLDWIKENIKVIWFHSAKGMYSEPWFFWKILCTKIDVLKELNTSQGI